MSWYSIVLTGLVSLGFNACSKEAQPHPPRSWPDPGLVNLRQPLQSVPPSTFEIDNSLVSSALDKGKQIQGLESVVMVKNGKLIGEKYFTGQSNTLRHIRSCTKSILGLLAGMISDSLLDLNQPIVKFVVPHLLPELDTAMQRVTIRNLLHMTSGFQWNETDYEAWWKSPKPSTYLFQNPMEGMPGKIFNYNSPAVHLLGHILTVATEQPLNNLISKRLFEPLGIDNFQWEQDPQNNYNGSSGLQLTARDAAKIGYLMVQRGHNGLNQLISREYIAASSNNILKPMARDGYKELGYGQLWWTETGQINDAVLAWGYGGQFIYCVPAEHLVLVTTASWYLPGDQATSQVRSIVEYLANTLLVAVQ
jgi:CubicO group peptidase (beta-lactamase class C family)